MLLLEIKLSKQKEGRMVSSCSLFVSSIFVCSTFFLFSLPSNQSKKAGKFPPSVLPHTASHKEGGKGGC